MNCAFVQALCSMPFVLCLCSTFVPVNFVQPLFSLCPSEFCPCPLSMPFVHALCPMHFVLFLCPSAFCSTFVHVPLFYAFCLMPFVLCLLYYAFCLMPFVLCLLFNLCSTFVPVHLSQCILFKPFVQGNCAPGNYKPYITNRILYAL
jgi:hypothetical protein